MVLRSMHFSLRFILVMALILSLAAAIPAVVTKPASADPGGAVDVVIDADAGTGGIQATRTVAKNAQFTVAVWVVPQGQATDTADFKVNFDPIYLEVDVASYNGWDNVYMYLADPEDPHGNLFITLADRSYSNTADGQGFGHADYAAGVDYGLPAVDTTFRCFYIRFNAKANTPVAGTQLTFNSNPDWLPKRITDAFYTDPDTQLVSKVTGNRTPATIKIQSAPSINFSADDETPTAGQEVHFTATEDAGSGPVTSWAWTFGDGGTSDVQNPTHTYTTVGTYEVVLVGTNGISSDTETKAGYITVAAGEPAKLAFNPAPGASQTAGITWPEFKVEIQDAHDNKTTSTAEVTVTPSTGAFAEGDNSVAADNGVATFTGLKYNVAATIKVRANALALPQLESGDITVGAAGKNKLAFTRQPASPGKTVDDAFSTQPKVEIQDQFGNKTADTDSITLTPWRSDNHDTAGDGVLRNATMNAVGGIADFANVGYSKPDSIHLKAASGSLVPAFSTEAIALTVGAPAQLVYAPAPNPAQTAGIAWGEFKVNILDAYGNQTASTAEVTVTPSTGAFAEGDNSIEAVDGVATFTGLKYNVAATIKARANALTLPQLESDNITVGAAGKNKLAFTRQPASPGKTVDDAFSTQPKVEIQDEFGNKTADTDSITLTPWRSDNHDTAGDGVLRNATMDAVGGVADFANVGYSKLDSINLKAASGELIPAFSTEAITLTVGAPAQLVYAPAPNPAQTAGVVWPDFKVDILDQFGNKTASTAEVTVTPSAGAFAEGDNSVAAINGTATFTGLKYNVAATIKARANALSLPQLESGNIVVGAGALHHVIVSPASKTLVVTTPQTFTAEAQDEFNNPIPSAVFVWTVANATAGTIANPAIGNFVAGTTPGVYTEVIVATVDGTEISGKASVTVTGATITVTAILQGPDRTLAGHNVPLTFKVFDQNIAPADVLTAEAAYTLTKDGTAPEDIVITGTVVGTHTITFTVSGLPVGTYDVTLHTPHALITLRDNAVIAASGTSFTMGTLIEGNADESDQVTGADFSLLLNDYASTAIPSHAKWNGGRCDFDCSGNVDSVDFSLMAMNYNATAPQAVED